MVKSLEPGMKFLIPLSDGRFLPGYVVLDGNLFTLVNVFSNAQGESKEPMNFPEDQILFRDWLIGDHVFSRSKRIIEIPWRLFRNKKLDKPDSPQIEGRIFGEIGREVVKDLSTSKVIREIPTKEDFDSLPRHEIKSADYYAIAAEAKLLGKKVVLKMPEREYVIE